AVFSPNDSQLVTIGSDSSVLVWDLSSGVVGQRLSESASGAAFSPDGARLATINRSGNGVHLWNLATGELVATLQGHSGSVTAVAFSPDGTQVVTSGWDNTARIYPATPQGFLTEACGLLRYQPEYTDVVAACAPYVDRNP